MLKKEIHTALINITRVARSLGFAFKLHRLDASSYTLSLGSHNVIRV